VRRQATISGSRRYLSERAARQGIDRSETRPTRVFILSEHTIDRDALRVLLEAEPDLRVVGTASDYTAARKPARDCRPDIFLLDHATSVLPRSDTLRTLATSCAPARVLLLAPDLDNAQICEALRLGVAGVVLKGVSRELLFTSIRAVASGQHWAGRKAVDLVEHARTPSTPAPATPQRECLGLTARELEIVSAVIGGGANREIATQYGIGERTVKHHLTNIFDKLGLSTRLELAMFALEHHLVAIAQTDRLA
jgi:two-component system, NarL family, nitrate/nitrite response regulator NarL